MRLIGGPQRRLIRDVFSNSRTFLQAKAEGGVGKAKVASCLSTYVSQLLSLVS